jgi:hypothetical protein
MFERDGERQRRFEPTGALRLIDHPFFAEESENYG